MRLWVPWSPPSCPLFSPSFQLSCFVPCDTMLVSYDTNLHTLQLSTYAHAPPEDDTPLCTPRDHNPECLPNNEENRKRGTFLLFFSDKFWCKSSLPIHCPCQILSLYLKTFITYCPLPPQTCASFSSFPPCTLYLSHPSFPLVSYFLTFLRS